MPSKYIADALDGTVADALLPRKNVREIHLTCFFSQADTSLTSQGDTSYMFFSQGTDAHGLQVDTSMEGDASLATVATTLYVFFSQADTSLTSQGDTSYMFFSQADTSLTKPGRYILHVFFSHADTSLTSQGDTSYMFFSARQIHL